MRAIASRIDTHHAWCSIRTRTGPAHFTPNSSAHFATCNQLLHILTVDKLRSLRSTACVMAGRSASAVLVLGFLVVAAFCMTEASAMKPKGGLLDVDVLIKLNNKCQEDVRLVVGVGKVLDCKKGQLAVLGPVTVKLEALNLLKLQLFVFDKNGKLLKVKAVLNVNLGLLGKLIEGVTELVLDVVEEVVEGVEGKVIKLLCGNKVLVHLLVEV
ncbi:hypothetical protein M758_7G130300 [Ceratodon purpureus]|nr:hypothetical protein M758_7G130300 [Ceratodon purpureus]